MNQMVSFIDISSISHPNSINNESNPLSLLYRLQILTDKTSKIFFLAHEIEISSFGHHLVAAVLLIDDL
jgi:hypothetical protein